MGVPEIRGGNVPVGLLRRGIAAEVGLGEARGLWVWPEALNHALGGGNLGRTKFCKCGAVRSRFDVF